MSNRKKPKSGKSKTVRARPDGNVTWLTKKSGRPYGVVRNVDTFTADDGTLMANKVDIQRPGLDGTFADTCLVCIKPTDTALSIDGEAEFIIGALLRMGLTEKTANSEVAHYAGRVYGCANAQFPVHDMTMTFRVCAECAAKVNMTPALLVNNTTPCYRQAVSMRYFQTPGLMDLALNARDEWAAHPEPKPLIISEDSCVLGSWSRAQANKTEASGGDSVPVMRVPLVYQAAEPEPGQREYHVVADIATGGSLGVPLSG